MFALFGWLNIQSLGGLDDILTEIVKCASTQEPNASVNFLYGWQTRDRINWEMRNFSSLRISWNEWAVFVMFLGSKWIFNGNLTEMSRDNNNNKSNKLQAAEQRADEPKRNVCVVCVLVCLFSFESIIFIRSGLHNWFGVDERQAKWKAGWAFHWYPRVDGVASRCSTNVNLNGSN